MLLSEAISHLEQLLEDPKHFLCQECRDEHVQLWRWLIELQQYRNSSFIVSQNANEINKILTSKEISRF